VSRGESSCGKATTLPPHNEGELLQAANAVGMSDRIVYLRDLINDKSKTITGQCIPESGDTDDYNLGANGSIPSFDSPSMIMYTSGTTGKIEERSMSVILHHFK